MKVTKAQAQENRARIVETASTLFREHGFDGIGIAELMAAAGLTHGGFYKHFRSKADLIAEASACGMAQSIAGGNELNLAEFIERYLSREHRDARDAGCTLAALCGDAARQPTEVKTRFAEGIESSLVALSNHATKDEPDEIRGNMIAALAQAAGALSLSRACPDDSPLANEILEVCRARILNSLRSKPID